MRIVSIVIKPGDGHGWVNGTLYESNKISFDFGRGGIKVFHKEKAETPVVPYSSLKIYSVVTD